MKISIYLKHSDVECFNFYNTNLQKLQEKIEEADIVNCRNTEEFLSHLPDTDIAVIWYFKQEWLEPGRKLKWIVTPAAGRDYFEVKPGAGIGLDYCSFHGGIMGETVLAMMLAEARGIRNASSLQQSPWPRADVSKHMTNFRGSRVTILGFGHIGTWVARLAKPFGVRITGIKRSLTPKPDFLDADDRIVTTGELDFILPDTDHLVISLPGMKETSDIINRVRLALLPTHGVIYNVGRGNAIDETALADALRLGRLAAAYLDVFETEPLTGDSPLLNCPNLFRMPHVSAAAPNYMDLFIEEFVVKYNKKYMNFDS